MRPSQGTVSSHWLEWNVRIIPAAFLSQQWFLIAHYDIIYIRIFQIRAQYLSPNNNQEGSAARHEGAAGRDVWRHHAGTRVRSNQVRQFSCPPSLLVLLCFLGKQNSFFTDLYPFSLLSTKSYVTDFHL